MIWTMRLQHKYLTLLKGINPVDYKTKPVSRDELRIIAKAIRQIFKCRNKYFFDVIRAFEMVPTIFPQITTAVVDDDEFDPRIPARCIPDFNGNYLIEVKNSIYEGAVAGVGGYRAHILHEICHAFLCILGFTPILDREFRNNELKPYESMEWQAKALCGEIMMPYEETDSLSVKQIIHYCKVSTECAQLRANNYRKKKTP